MTKNQNGKTTKSENKDKLIAEIPLSGTKQIRIAISDYKGNKYFAMREQYKSDAEDEEWLWGRGGLNLPIKKLTAKSCRKLAKIFENLAIKLVEKEIEADDD